MCKLTGSEYLKYWRDRMAKGPDQAGFNGQDAEAQGALIWDFIRPEIECFTPKFVFEFGCGYGRMLRKLAGLWPEAEFLGADISREALLGCFIDWPTIEMPFLIHGSCIPLGGDLFFTCLALQHVTDEAMFRSITEDIAIQLNPGGVVVLFENVSLPGAPHLRDMTVSDYMGLFPRLHWRQPKYLALSGEPHALMVGQR